MPDSGDAGTNVYVAVGAELTNYVLDANSGALSACATVRMPARVQFAAAHPLAPVLYVGCADRGGASGEHAYFLVALARDAQGALSPLGDPVDLPARPIHLTTDAAGRHVLVAYGGAPGLSVFKTAVDGTVGREIPCEENFAFGVKPHQVRVLPTDDRAVLVARGAKGFATPSYAAGGFMLVRYDRGRVENVQTVAPEAGDAPRGFNPRNVDFHPTLPLMFATLEAQNELAIFPIGEGAIDPAPAFVAPILASTDAVFKRQDGGQVHVHPGGHAAYVANRNDGYVSGHSGVSWLNPDPIPVFPGGENNIAVFALDRETGRPAAIQHVDTHGLHPLNFALDRSGRFLVAGNIAPTLIEVEGERVAVPASIVVFRIGADGRLTLAHKLDLTDGLEKAWWMGVC